MTRKTWAVLAAVVLVIAGLMTINAFSVELSGGSKSALIQWVRTNDPANTDSDQKLLNLADRVCSATPENRYKIPTDGLPIDFTSAALGLYCPAHK